MSLKDRMLGIDRQHGRFRQVGPGTDPAFLETSGEVGFRAPDRAELYGGVERTLGHHNYPKLPCASQGLLRRYVAKMTGLSRAQTARLIRHYQ